MAIDLNRHLGGGADVIKADMVRGKSPTITITAVSEEDFPNGDTALYVSCLLKGKKWRVKANARSARGMADTFGRVPERDWIGKQVRLAHTPGGTPQYDSITLEPVS